MSEGLTCIHNMSYIRNNLSLDEEFVCDLCGIEGFELEDEYHALFVKYIKAVAAIKRCRYIVDFGAMNATEQVDRIDDILADWKEGGAE